MKNTALASIAITILALTIAIIVSLSGPGKEPEPSPPPPPPPFEELMPQGARADSDVTVRVLMGEDIVEISMERFLIGVVSAEMPASFEPEALKAQAVAARTDVLYNMYIAHKPRHPDADVCSDHTCCMAYTEDERLRENWGADYVENITKIIGAVLGTDGVYISYNNEPILAVFHSSSAGKTETSGNVWLSDLPYLLSVDTPETEEQVPNFVSTVTVSETDFTKTVYEAYQEAVFGEDATEWITDAEFTAGGRISKITVGGVTISGPTLRSLFGLRSTAVSIELVGSDIVFTTTGYGHGVGMSQYGANVMALSGRTYREILAAYYTGVTLVEPESAQEEL